MYASIYIYLLCMHKMSLEEHMVGLCCYLWKGSRWLGEWVEWGFLNIEYMLPIKKQVVFKPNIFFKDFG